LVGRERLSAKRVRVGTRLLTRDLARR